ncbi:MAG: hypothetical protein A2X22_04965 [Bacteroidetes bacterium GWF2_49_14]|nr:MAG: hypothetical protein A2X22_04965 [Bacteroidetes bacterium GWF2_49_14]
MKRYISFLLLSGLLFTASCNKDFLERYPLDELSPTFFFNNPEELQLFANRFYTLLPAHQGYFNTFMIDRNSDNIIPAVFDARLGGTRPLPSSALDGGWTWSDIRQANYFLAHCDSAGGVQKDIDQAVGEVRFFRAFLYFDKVRTFGDVPWINKPLSTDSPELFLPRTSRKIIVDSIIADLDKAISLLYPAAKASDSRINQEVAMLFKARVCLYEGTWEKYHAGTPFGVPGSDGSQFLQQAAECAGQLMSGTRFSLYKGPVKEEYWSLFNPLDLTGNPEVLLWKKFDVGLQVVNNVSRILSGGGGNIGLSKGLIDSYLCTDGMPRSVSPLFMGYDSMESEVANRDPRLVQTIFLKGYDQITNAPGDVKNQKFNLPALDGAGEFRNTSGYALYKGVNPDFINQGNNDVGTQGSIIFRLAEAYLIFAEAKAELGTINQADLDKSVNLLRDRVGMIHLDINNIVSDPMWDFPNLSPIINEIRRERRVELVCEGFRWDDLARWRAHHLLVGKRLKGVKYLGTNLEGAYKDFLGNPTIFIGHNLYVDDNGFVDPYQVALPGGFGFNPGRDYLSPIPSDELTLNSALTQNPGW